MAKATQVKAQLNDNFRKPCVVCGRLSLPYGYVARGKAQVCSKDCQTQYTEVKNGNV